MLLLLQLLLPLVVVVVLLLLMLLLLSPMPPVLPLLLPLPPPLPLLRCCSAAPPAGASAPALASHGPRGATWLKADWEVTRAAGALGS